MLLNWYIGLIVRPVSTLREIVDARPVALGLLTLLVVAILNGAISIGLQLDTDVSSDVAEVQNEVGVVSVIVWAIVAAMFATMYFGFTSLIAHIISRLLGGNGAYTGMWAGLMMLSILSLIPVIPSLLDALAKGFGEAAVGDTSPFGGIAYVVRIVVAIWTLILAVILIRENYRLSTGVAVLSSVIWIFVTIVIPFALLFLLLLAVVLSNWE